MRRRGCAERGPSIQEWVCPLKWRERRVETTHMTSTSWQHVRTLHGDVEHTLQRLRAEVFASGAFYLADDPARELSVCDVARSGRGGCLERPVCIHDVLAWNGDEGSHSVLDIIAGTAPSPTTAAVSPMRPAELLRCFGSDRPNLFAVLMSDFDAADVCRPGSGRFFTIVEPGEPVLVVFVGRTGT